MKLANMKVDHKVSAEGEWIKNIPDMDDLELLVRGQSCPQARVLRAKLLRALPANVRNNPDGLPPEVVDEIEAKICAEALLLGWRNLDDTPYTIEKALELLNDPDFVTLRDAVGWASSRVGRQAVAARGTELGNSGTTSAGT